MEEIFTGISNSAIQFLLSGNFKDPGSTGCVNFCTSCSVCTGAFITFYQSADGQSSGDRTGT